jgi:hypothetical protein
MRQGVWSLPGKEGYFICKIQETRIQVVDFLDKDYDKAVKKLKMRRKKNG